MLDQLKTTFQHLVYGIARFIPFGRSTNGHAPTAPMGGAFRATRGRLAPCMKVWKNRVQSRFQSPLWKKLFCHRMFYGALSLCHANGCWMTDYPALYAPMAIVYAGLAIRG